MSLVSSKVFSKFLTYCLFASLIPLFRLFLTSLYAAASPDQWLLHGLFVARVLTVFTTVTSSINSEINPITASVYSCRSMESPDEATFLKMLHCVHSKQPCSAGRASSGHTLMLFIDAGSFLTLGLYTGSSMTVGGLSCLCVVVGQLYMHLCC